MAGDSRMRFHRVRSAACLGIALVVALALTGCPSEVPSPETVVSPGAETSMAYVSGLSGVAPPTWLAAFNGGASGHGWALSTNDGASWTAFDAWTPGTGGPTAGTPMNIIPPGLPGQGVDSAGRPVWAGDPAIAASPDGTVVAMANLACGGLPCGTIAAVNAVVVSLSYDGGRTFPQSFQVNSKGCSDGQQDQETIAFDSTADLVTGNGQLPELWIGFRHRGGEIPLLWGACVRGARIDPQAQTLTWLNPATDIATLDRDFGRGVGGLVIQARDGIVSLMYSNTDYFGRNGAGNPICPIGGSGQVRWFLTESTDDGASWTGAEYIAGPATLPCFVSGVEIGIRNFGFAQSPQGMQYFAVPANEVSPRGSPEAIDIWRRDRSLGAQPPLILDGQVQGGTAAGGNPVFWPTLAADSIGRVALLWGSGVGISSTNVQYHMTYRDTAGVWDGIGVAVTPSLQSIYFTNLPLQPPGWGIDGDYLGIVGRTSDLAFPDIATSPAFVGAWSDSSQFTVTTNVGTVMASSITVRP